MGKKFWKRIVAGILSFVMLIGLFGTDFSALSAKAAVPPVEGAIMGEYGTYYEDDYGYHHKLTNSHLAQYMGYTGKGVKVAVLSTGVRTTHESLPKIATINIGLGLEDEDGTGTAICSLIAGKPGYDSDVGIAPDVELYSIKVSNHVVADESEYIYIKNGIYSAINTAHVDIICLGSYNLYYDTRIEAAIEYAYSMGVPVFCAAGDYSSGCVAYTGQAKGAITVAGLSKSLTRWNESCYGKNVRYSALADKFNLPFFSADDSYSSHYMGTSFATAIMTGLAAQMWCTIDGAGQQRVDNLLKVMDKSCIKVNGNGLGKGMVNVAAALGIKDDTQTPAKPVLYDAMGVITNPGGVLKSGTINGRYIEIMRSKPEKDCEYYYTLDGSTPSAKRYLEKDNDDVLAWPNYYDDTIYIADDERIRTLKMISYNSITGASSPVVTYKFTFAPKDYEIYLNPKTDADDRNERIYYPGEKFALKVTSYPAYLKTPKGKWSVRDYDGKAGTVKINSAGVVSIAKNAASGSYAVYYETVDGKRDSYKFEVKNINEKPDIKIKTITAERNITIDMIEEKEQFVPVEILYSDGTKGAADDLIWSGSNDSIAEIYSKTEDGVIIRGNSWGKAVITGTAGDGSRKYVKINVTVNKPVTKIEFPDTKPVHIAQGKSAKLKAVVYPNYATNKKLLWAGPSDVPGITVTNGTVRVAKDVPAGLYTITATAADGSGISAETQIKVVEAKKTTRFFIASYDRVQTIGRQQYSDSGYFNVECDTDAWSVKSSNPNMLRANANHDKDYVYFYVPTNAVKTGTVTLTVFTTDGTNKRATIKVNIVNSIDSVVISPQSGRCSELAKGKKVKLIPYIVTEEGKVSAASSKLEWKITSDPSKARVDQNGNVTALAGDGSQITVRARTKDGKQEAYYYLCQTPGIYQFTGGPEKEMTVGDTTYRSFGIIDKDNKEEVRTGSLESEIDITVSKPGLSVYAYKSGIKICATKAGTYKVTVKAKDGTNVSKSYTVKVNEK